VKRFALLAAFAIACSSNVERATRDVCARGDDEAERIEDATFAWSAVDEHGAVRAVRLADFFSTRGELLVVRVQGGAWCGTCRWSAAHTGELFALPHGDRLRVLDLVLGDSENAPATIDDALGWRASLDARDRVTVAADPKFALRALVPRTGTILPMTVLVDARSMTPVASLANPDPSELAREVDAAFAAIDGTAPRAPAPEALVDGFFRRNEWDMIRDVTLPSPPPRDASNAEIALGEALFFDEGMSPAKIACATCHDPSRGFGEASANKPNRKTPRIALAATSKRLFWDGRASTLEEQAKGPIENPNEMGSSPAFVARRVVSAFGALHRAAFPDHVERDAYDDATKAIAAYERTLRAKPTALDRYVAGDRRALTALEKQGLAAFAREGCMQCHFGPRLADDAFHVTRTPTGRADGAPDRGRAAIAPNAREGSFKTPSLRGVARATSFGHGGVFRSVDAIVASYGDGGLDVRDARAAGEREAWLPRFGETTRWSIDAFLATLTE